MSEKNLTKIVIDLNATDKDGFYYTRATNAEKPVVVGENILAYESEEGTAIYGTVERFSKYETKSGIPLIYLNLDVSTVFNLYDM